MLPKLSHNNAESGNQAVQAQRMRKSNVEKKQEPSPVEISTDEVPC